MLAAISSVLLALVTIAQSGAGGTATKVETRSAPLVELKLADGLDSPRVRAATQAIVDTTWKDACALFGVDAAPREPRASMQLYAAVADYEAACDRLVGGQFKRNQCFSEWGSISAHVLLQPAIVGDARSALAPTFDTLRIAAHETAHLVRFTKLPNNQRDHPGWLCDGAASWLETRALAEQKLLETPEKSPRHASDDLRVQRMLKLDRLPGLDDLVHDRTDALEFYDRYAVRWLLFRFLVVGAHAKQYRAFLADVRGLGGGTGFVDRAASALLQRLGASDWRRLDAEFRAWIPTLKPEWEQPSGSLACTGKDWTQCSFDSNAVAFTLEAAGSKPYSIAGTVTVYTDRAKSPQMNLLLGRQVLSNETSRFVSIAFTAGVGVTLFEYDGGAREADAWTNRGFGATNDTAPGKPLPFRVDCEPRSGKTVVTVRIADKVVAQATIGRVLDGAWGVGAQSGSSGVWHDVKLVPLTAR